MTAVIENAVSAKIKRKVATFPQQPGVYRMVNAEAQVIYVGKAKNLLARVRSYFSGTPVNTRTMRMVMSVVDVQYTLTKTEAEALLLEDALIKKLMPPYNVKLRDDKTYPWLIMRQGTFPALSMFRGARQAGVAYFGPFPNVAKVRKTLKLINKTFKLRTCSDSNFANRVRPCLEHQIGNCSAPCVGYRSAEDYQYDCTQAAEFLRGKNAQLLMQIQGDMQAAAAKREYEQAAMYRNRITALHGIMDTVSSLGDKSVKALDIILGAPVNNAMAYSVVQVRNGGVQDAYERYVDIPKDDADLLTDADAIAAMTQRFLLSWYSEKPEWIPDHIYVEPHCAERLLTQAALSKLVMHNTSVKSDNIKSDETVQIVEKLSKKHQQWLKIAQANIENLIHTAKYSSSSHFNSRFTAMLEDLAMQTSAIEAGSNLRVECLDISHHGGESTSGACVVFDQFGPKRPEWRSYKLGNMSGDDYGALAATVSKKYKSQQDIPFILIVDGGELQLTRVAKELALLGLKPHHLLGIGKGKERKYATDRFYVQTQNGMIDLTLHKASRYILQYIRDASHNFAIRTHRQRMRKAKVADPLVTVEGIGPQLSKKLLYHFGGYQALKAAQEEELAKVKGLGGVRAKRLYNFLQNN